MKSIKFYFQAFILITFSKEFQAFENEFFGTTTERFFMNGKRIFSEKEKNFLNVIKNATITDVCN